MALNLLNKFGFPSRNMLLNFQQMRSAYIVERVREVGLVKPNKNPTMRARHYVYKTVEDNVPKTQKMLTLVLRKYVEDVGQAGEVVSLKEQIGRFLVMTHKAAYASRANIEKYASSANDQKTYSSKYAAKLLKILSTSVLNISMNKENPWTLERWHVSSAFRKAGFTVPESAITMPDHNITGPDMALEGKEFYITVTINGQEKVIVRSRIHHWATNLADKLPRVRDHWKFPAEPVFAEDKAIAATLPEMIPPVFEEDDDDDEEFKRMLMMRRRRQNMT